MAERKVYTVATQFAGLNLREEPSRGSKIISVLANGAKVSVDKDRTAPDGWIPVKGGGYVMDKYLK